MALPSLPTTLYRFPRGYLLHAGAGYALGRVLCAINLIVAIGMVDRFSGARGWFASMYLVLIGMYLATYGAGRYSLDHRVLIQR